MYRGQPRLLRKPDLTVMAIAYSSEIKQSMLRAAGATRRQRGERNMNATAPIAPAAPQHMRALARANHIRLRRAELKRGVAAGKIDVAEVIVYCPWEANGMAVADLLPQAPRPAPRVREEDGRVDDRPTAARARGDAQLR